MSAVVQTHFLDRLLRTVVPAPDRAEPDVWFREIRLFDDLSARPVVERRRIVLHRGLNILWARPEDAEIEQGLYRDGLAGHASGKTIFCRILRYLLGESNFGTEAQRDGIAKCLPALFAAGLVRLKGTDWVVGRPLGGMGSEFAVKAGSVDAVLGSDPPTSGYGEFREALKVKCGAVGEALHPGEGWRHLLPWLTRDQEARFSSLAAWRDPASQGDNPQSKVSDRHLLMRAVLDLLDLREPALRLAIESAEFRRDAAQQKAALIENTARAQADVARSSARESLGAAVPEGLEALEVRVGSMADVLKEGMTRLEQQPEPPPLRDARREFEDARDHMVDAQREIEHLVVRADDLRKQQKEKLAFVRNLRTGDVEDSARRAEGWCPKTIQYAIRRKCVEAGSVSGDSATNLAELESEAQALAAEGDRLDANRTELISQMPAFEAEMARTRQRLDAAARLASADAIKLARQLERTESLVRLVRTARASQAKVTQHQREMEALSSEIASTKEEADSLRKDMTDKLVRFANDFADIVRAVMGASVEASVTVDSSGLTPKVTRKQELSGAALDTIKTVAFDLAAMVASIEGRGHHPRLLVHDGPREGDMARVIYERFFLYVAGLEKAFPSPDEASFQYIITTTTHPPRSMREGSRWLLEPVLNSRDKSTRLLKEDF